jgi:hypothetical protein
LRQRGEAPGDADAAQLATLGRQWLQARDDRVRELEVLGEGLENSPRPTVILKARQGYQAYRQMLHSYAVRNLLDYVDAHREATLESLHAALAGPRQSQWTNLGGQLVPAGEVDRLRADVRVGKLRTWPEIHQRYDELWQAYPEQKQRHALATLLHVLGVPRLTAATWRAALDEAVRIQEYVRDQVYLSRKKDYDNAFRTLTYRNPAEQAAVLGMPEDNGFVKQVRAETDAFAHRVAAARTRLG